MKTHTAGPWNVEINDMYRCIMARESQRFSVASMTVNSNNSEANAALIAAAPEMFATLERISKRIAACPHIITTDPDFYEWQDALGFIKIWADSAIYKAKGEI